MTEVSTVEEQSPPIDLGALALETRAAIEKVERDEGDVLEGRLHVGRCLHAARQAFRSHIKFGDWMREVGIGYSTEWARIHRLAAQHEDAVRAAFRAVPIDEQPNFQRIVLAIASSAGTYGAVASRLANERENLLPDCERADRIASALGSTRTDVRKANEVEAVLRAWEEGRRESAIEMAADRVSHVERDDIEKVVDALLEGLRGDDLIPPLVTARSGSTDCAAAGGGDLATVILGDVLEVLEKIPDRSIDLVITSAPYNLGTSSGGGFPARNDPDARMGKWSAAKIANGYNHHSDDLTLDEYVAWQRTVLEVLWDKLTDHGAIFYNHKNRVQNGVLWQPLVELNPGLPLRQVIVWKLSSGVNFNPTFLLPRHEVIGVFAKPGWRLRNEGRGVSGLGDVWEMKQASSEHPAPFPLELPTRAILVSANVNTVLDPYCGSGTTLLAASNAGIHSIGIDNDPWAIEMTRQRLGHEPSR